MMKSRPKISVDCCILLICCVIRRGWVSEQYPTTHWWYNLFFSTSSIAKISWWEIDLTIKKQQHKLFVKKHTLNKINWQPLCHINLLKITQFTCSLFCFCFNSWSVVSFKGKCLLCCSADHWSNIVEVRNKNHLKRSYWFSFDLCFVFLPFRSGRLGW